MPDADPQATDDREWISFQDGDGDTWLFDVTMLTSNWKCIWGDGCRGIAPEIDAAGAHGCCIHGAHFTGDEDRARVVASAERLGADQWANHGRYDDPLTVDDDGEPVTRTHGGVCVFHNPVGFTGGEGCALHIAALEAGESPIDWKPDVCWQLPLRLEHHEDDHGHSTWFVGEWKRRHWGDGGDEFGWWCTESPEAYRADEPVYHSLEDELRALVGDHVYERLRHRLEVGDETPVAHPARRAR